MRCPYENAAQKKARWQKLFMKITLIFKSLSAIAKDENIGANKQKSPDSTLINCEF